MGTMADNQAVLAAARQQLQKNQAALIDGHYPEAAVLVAITEGGDEPSVIMTQRADHMNLHPGESAFPGGKQDPEDDSLLATALREANEEVGLLASAVDYLGPLDQRLTRTAIRVSPFVGLVDAATPLSPNLDELSSIYRIPLSFLSQPDNLQVLEKEYQGTLWRVPHFEYQGYSVWGVTAMILVDLVNTAFGVKLRV
jgi:8-oxo-dGTP pyrophosphatase MutT (NUDIX family)